MWFGVLCVLVFAGGLSGEVRVDCGYAGGNIVVEGIEGDTVRVRPDLRDTAGWWFYWNLRVRGAQGRDLTFKFEGRDPIGTRGPAVSRDGGKSWSWMGAEANKGGEFSYSFGAEDESVRFCFTFPYVQADLDRFLGQYEGDANLAVEKLCESRKHRAVELLRAGRIDGGAKYRALVTARHHACESIASYALEGLIAAVLADDEYGKWLRENVEIAAVPFVDKDGVEGGDQGKNRRPRDHNRDYVGESIYPEVAAIRRLADEWGDGKLRVVLDLHCPYIRGNYNEFIYMVGSSDDRIWVEQMRFGRMLEAQTAGAGLEYRAADNLPFGTAWNTSKNYSQGKSCSRWGAALDGVRLSTGMEIPYANVREQTVTADDVRQFGRVMGRALRQYLRASEK